MSWHKEMVLPSWQTELSKVHQYIALWLIAWFKSFIWVMARTSKAKAKHQRSISQGPQDGLLNLVVVEEAINHCAVFDGS